MADNERTTPPSENNNDDTKTSMFTERWEELYAKYADAIKSGPVN